MDEPRFLTIKLLSDATFAGGVGPGTEVDVEVEHDELGLPIISGKTLHGLLHDTWAAMAPVFSELAPIHAEVLGEERDLAETAILRVGTAQLPEDVRRWVRTALERRDAALHPKQILRTLTDVRYQTALARSTGAPAHQTLRSSRVVRRGLTLQAPLHWLKPPRADYVRMLALVALGTRHGGWQRNRGRGHIQVLLDGDWEGTLSAAGLKGEGP